MVSEKSFKFLSILSLWELYVAMTTNVPNQTAQKLYAAFPLPDDALHEI